MPNINVSKIFVSFILAQYESAKVGKYGQYFISSDLDNWREIPLEEAKEDLLILPIPISYQATEYVYLKFVPAGETAVAGFALIQ